MAFQHLTPRVFVFLWLWIPFIALANEEVIHIKHQEGDITPLIRKHIENINSKDVKIVFEKGIYNFKREYTKEQYSFITNHGNGLKRIAFLFENLNSVEIEGNDSKFIFNGQIAPFQFKNCSNISVKNLTIDWNIPFVFQGEITATNPKEHWYEIKPYTKGYSWNIHKGQLQFPGINHFNYTSLGNTLAFNKSNKQVDYGALDMSLRSNRVEKKTNGILRFYNHDIRQFPRIGSVLHSKGPHSENRYAPAFQFVSSKNIILDSITIHHALGMGFLFERSENIKILNSGIYVEEGSDRVVSTTADATHFANCKGDILIENCRFEGMLDDGTNVHGTYVKINKILNKKTVRFTFGHYEQTGFNFAEKGDAIWFIKSPNPSRAEENIVSSVKYINDKYSDITFENEIPSDLKVGDMIENKTWNPVFTIRGCTIRDHRARNIIIKTPKKITIENNNFSSMMSSIMLRGETFYWFESGNVEDVIIRNNTFTHCVYGGAPKHAILKISPRLGKSFDSTITYDRNIIFENNTIETFDNRIVWADRVDNLIIKGNTIKQTFTAPQQFPKAPIFEFINCTNVEVSKNTYNGNATNFIKADKRTKNTLKIKKNKGFSNK